jgi:hypothetical protein
MKVMFRARTIREANRIEYQHRPAVLMYPGPHAKANAAYAAQLLEADRQATRRAELRTDLHMQRMRLLAELAQVDAALEALEVAGG